MKAASCSSPIFVKHGLPRGKPQSCVIVKRVIGFRRSGHSRSLPDVSGWVFTWSTTLSTSRAWRLLHSFKTSCAIFPARSCSCGMAVKFTDATRWLNLFSNMRGFGFIVFRSMRQSSTRLNLFGPKPRTLSQTACMSRNQHSMPICGNPSKEPVDRSNYSDLVSMHLICPGNNS